MEVSVVTATNKELIEAAQQSAVLKQAQDKEVVLDFRKITNFDKVIDRDKDSQDFPLDRKISKTLLVKLVEALNEALTHSRTKVEFKIHESSKNIIIKIIDTRSKKVIKEMPSEKMLDMIQKFLELSGFIVDEMK